MPDLFSKVSELLSDPRSADQIRQIASSLASGEPPSGPLPSGIEGDAGASAPVSAGLTDVAPLLSGLSAGSHSRDLALLQAVRPYLRSSRAGKIDSAIKAIRVIDLLSALR